MSRRFGSLASFLRRGDGLKRIRGRPGIHRHASHSFQLVGWASWWVGLGG